MVIRNEEAVILCDSGRVGNGARCSVLHRDCRALSFTIEPQSNGGAIVIEQCSNGVMYLDRVAGAASFKIYDPDGNEFTISIRCDGHVSEEQLAVIGQQISSREYHGALRSRGDSH